MSADCNHSLALFGCVDWANNERTLAYHAWACANALYPEGCSPVIEDLCFCADDAPVNPYVDPITDDVCWYDAAVPESSEFLGVIILGLSGIRNSTFSRQVTDGFLEGSILQRPTIRGRSFGFDILILATSCAGRNYGIEWLRRLFEEMPCGKSSECDSCLGRSMVVRTHCPDVGDADVGLHEWLSVGLVDGLSEVQNGGGKQRCACVLTRMTFTMQSESQYSFSCSGEEVINRTASNDENTEFIRCYDWGRDCIECQEDCCQRCQYDALCTCYPPQPIVPTLVEDECFCTPLAKIIQCECLPALPHGYDSTFKIDIFSGFDYSDDQYERLGLRNFELKIYENPRDYPCITDKDSYDEWCDRTSPCAVIRMAYIPSNAHLQIDGRTGRTTLICDGKCYPYDRVISSGLRSGVFPLVASCRPLMICAEWDFYHTMAAAPGPGVEPASIVVNRYLRFRN